MLDSDLADLYEVQTKRLNEAVSRNHERFPSNFMFQLTAEETASLRSHFATSNKGRGGRRYRPYAFTEHGVVMLSAVLNSDRAVQMSISVVNAFVRLRELVASNREIAQRVERLESGHARTGTVIEVLVEDIDKLGRKIDQIKAPSPYSRRRIGYITEDD
jgi:hypothetical protein